MATEHAKLTHERECCPQHWRMGTARMKEDKETTPEKMEYGKMQSEIEIQTAGALTYGNGPLLYYY